MLRHALLHFHLQGAVLGIPAGIAVYRDTVGLVSCADAASAELRERLRRQKRRRVVARGGTNLTDLAQGELVQIYHGNS